MRRSTVMIVEAKLARPRLPRVLKRDRLLRQLSAGLTEYPLLLVNAGAGYGKTTLLATLAAGAPITSLWYSLGAEDGDFAVFLTHLATALRRESLRYARSTTAFLREGQLTSRSSATAAGAFLNDLSRIREPTAIFLDDFHLVADSQEVVKFLSTVVENNRSPVHFVLASRTEPPLPLGRLRARGQVLELGPAELAFSLEEFRALFGEVYRREISEVELRQVVQFTEGWVTALQLALQAPGGAPGSGLGDALQRARQSHSPLHDYLAAEVVDLQTPEMRRFMLLTARLDEMETALLRTLFPGEDVDERLGALHRRHLAHVFEGAGGPVYRYHALLQDYLQRRARAELDLEEFDILHARAAEYCRARDDLAGAARHLAHRSDPASLVALLREGALRLLDLGHYQSLAGWLTGLPRPVLEGEPWLRLRLGDVRYYLGQWPEAEVEYGAARLAFRTSGERPGERWAMLGLARLWNLSGQAEAAAREIQAALEYPRASTTEGEAELDSRLHQVLSAAHFYLGHYAEALTALERLEPLIEGNPDRLAALWNNRAVIHASQGNYAAAARAFEKGLRFPGARSSPRAALHLTNLALLFNELGDAERARPLFEEALTRARRSQNRSQILSALMGQAHLAYRLGDLDGCLALMQEVELLNESPNLPLIRADALALRARLLARSGQHATARTTMAAALEAYGADNRDANWLLYRAQAAAIDLAAGPPEAPFATLSGLLAEAESLEALFPRALILFYLGEAARRLDRPEAAPRLREALKIGREMGYEAFFQAEWRQHPAPFELLLREGEACDDLTHVGTSAGPALEPALLPLIDDATLPEPSVKALLQMLAEAGGPAAHQRLSSSGWLRESPHARGTRACLEALERRYPELGGPAKAGRTGLYLETLGRLTLRGRSGELPREAWKSQRALSIFIYLALRAGRGASKDRLLELFWPGGQLRRAQQNFHPTLSYARRALRNETSGPVFVVKNGLYQLDPDLALTVDVRRFEARLADARAATDPAERIAISEEALTLYGGDFLEDRYEAWTEEIRTRLSLRYEKALADTAALHQKSEHPQRAAALYKIVTERNPLQEESHVRLMECLHLLGDRQAVKDQYEALRASLKRELKVDPLPETTRRYEALTRSTRGTTP